MVNVTEKDDFCIYCYDFDGQGKVINAKKTGVSNDAYMTWWHLDALNPDTETFLQNSMGLNPIITGALLAQDTRPRLEHFENGLLIILRGINTENPERPEDMISLRIWIDQERVITVRRRVLKSVQDLVEQLERGIAPQTGGDLLCYLIDRLTQRIAPVIETIEERCDTLEEALIDEPNRALRNQIIQTRKKAITLRRYLGPQRDVLSQLRNQDFASLSTQNKWQLQEYSSYSLRLVEDLDMLRERTQIIQDELTTTLADALNRNMYMLSVIAAIFLPLGFLTGLLGINVGGIPGAENPHAFWIFIGGLAILILCQILLFKKAKWF